METKEGVTKMGERDGAAIVEVQKIHNKTSTSAQLEAATNVNSATLAGEQ